MKLIKKKTEDMLDGITTNMNRLIIDLVIIQKLQLATPNKVKLQERENLDGVQVHYVKLCLFLNRFTHVLDSKFHLEQATKINIVRQDDSHD